MKMRSHTTHRHVAKTPGMASFELPFIGEMIADQFVQRNPDLALSHLGDGFVNHQAMITALKQGNRSVAKKYARKAVKSLTKAQRLSITEGEAQMNTRIEALKRSINHMAGLDDVGSRRLQT